MSGMPVGASRGWGLATPANRECAYGSGYKAFRVGGSPHLERVRRTMTGDLWWLLPLAASMKIHNTIFNHIVTQHKSCVLVLLLGIVKVAK